MTYRKKEVFTVKLDWIPEWYHSGVFSGLELDSPAQNSLIMNN
jgi:hypothetical protein